MNLRTVPAAVLVLSSVIGCGGGHHAAPVGSRTPSQPASSTAVEDTSTAAGTVVAYYQRLGRHDTAGAAALLESHLRAQYLHAGPDGEFENTVSVSNIREVHAAAAPSTQGLPAGYRDITQVFLTYDAVFHHVVAAGNGPNSRFVYVGRNAAGQWRILEVGTGP